MHKRYQNVGYMLTFTKINAAYIPDISDSNRINKSIYYQYSWNFMCCVRRTLFIGKNIVEMTFPFG